MDNRPGQASEFLKLTANGHGQTRVAVSEKTPSAHQVRFKNRVVRHNGLFTHGRIENGKYTCVHTTHYTARFAAVRNEKIR